MKKYVNYVIVPIFQTGLPIYYRTQEYMNFDLITENTVILVQFMRNFLYIIYNIWAPESNTQKRNFKIILKIFIYNSVA